MCYYFKCKPSELRGEDPVDLVLITEGIKYYEESRPLNQLIKKLGTTGLK